MKATKQVFTIVAGGSLAMAGLLTTTPFAASGAEVEAGVTRAAVATAGGGGGGGMTLITQEGAEPESRVHTLISAINPKHQPPRRDVPWLGVGIEEASDALTSQLRLKPGVGLVVNYVAPRSPAATAGFKENDVLVQFDDQSLVHPEQLRKLVRVLKTNDTVKLVFYRAGKRDTASVTLTPAPAGLESPESEPLQRFYDLRRLPHELDAPKALREQMDALRLGQGKMREDIRRSLQQAEKALHGALRNATNAGSSWESALKHYKDLAGSAITVDKNATVTVRSGGKGAKSLVKADDSGTIVLIRNPTLRLTAHDKDGNMVFDGEIESADQRDKVPRDLWERVEPLLDKMGGKPAGEPKAEESE